MKTYSFLFLQNKTTNELETFQDNKTFLEQSGIKLSDFFVQEKYRKWDFFSIKKILIFSIYDARKNLKVFPHVLVRMFCCVEKFEVHMLNYMGETKKRNVFARILKQEMDG